MSPGKAHQRAPARGGMLACPPARAAIFREGGPAAFSPAPELDEIFQEAPPSADEWRLMARALATLLEAQERPFSRGALTRELILAATLDGVRKSRPN